MSNKEIQRQIEWARGIALKAMLGGNAQEEIEAREPVRVVQLSSKEEKRKPDYSMAYSVLTMARKGYQIPAPTAEAVISFLLAESGVKVEDLGDQERKLEAQKLAVEERIEIAERARIQQSLKEQEEIEDLQDIKIIKEREDEESVSFDELVNDTVDEGAVEGAVEGAIDLKEDGEDQKEVTEKELLEEPEIEDLEIEEKGK